MNSRQWRMSPVILSPSALSACFQVILVLPFLYLFLARVDAGSVNRREEVNVLLNFLDFNSAEFVSLDKGYSLNWNKNDTTPCAWVGVTCTTNSTVEELDFSGWGLSVRHLIDLPQLRDLRVLDLSSNDMGYLQEGIGNLRGLTRLDLSRNIGHPLDVIALFNISACPNLRVLALEQSGISEVPSGIRNLVNLQFLNLANNQLKGSFPAKELGGLSSLVSLDLSGNGFEGSIPALQNLTSLIDLILDNNNFTGFEEPWFLGTETLHSLSVSNNSLEGMIPTSIASFANLMILNMSSNSLSGSIPSGFSTRMSLGMSLDLSVNQLSGEIPRDLLQQSDTDSDYTDSTSGNCASVNVSYNLLTGNLPMNTSDLICFDILDFSHNDLSGPIPLNISLNPFSQIFLFRLQNNQLSGDIVDALLGSAFQSASEFRVENNLFTGDLSRIADRKAYGSSNDSIFHPSSIFANISKRVARGVLDLSNNRLQWSVSEAFPDPMKTTLEVITSNWNLTEFRVGGNNFSGTSLPTSSIFLNTTDCSAPTVLDLSNCQLRGEILGEAFNHRCLEYTQLLNLSNNQATGTFPETLLPQFGQQFIVDVSNNNLSGPLPVILPSSNMYNSKYFAGNDELCGDPLPPCPQLLLKQGTDFRWWVLLIIIGGSVTIAMGSCLAATWRWGVYKKRHQQDADLIRTLLERDSASLMTLRDLKKATDNFAESAQIGEGGFGTVYIGKLNDGTVVAIKRSKREGSERDKEQFLNEVRILSQVNHRHLVKLLGCCMENKTAVLVFEFVPNGTLQEHLQGKMEASHLTWKQRLNVAVQVAEALHYLHSAAALPIIHRDVKSANILLNENLEAKVADFGISRLAPLRATHVSTVAIQGTMGYIDPEYYTSFQLTDKSDVYSFGVVLLELISAKPCIDFCRGGDETSLVNLGRPYIERGDLEQFIDPVLTETYRDSTHVGRESILNIGRLALKCLRMQSKSRPSMKQVLKDLQKFWLKFSGTAENVESIDEEGTEDLQFDNAALLSKSFARNSSTFTIKTDGGIEMSRSSSFERLRSKSIG